LSSRPVPTARRSYLSVLEELARRIETGSLPLGSRLPSERLLAEEMNASRTTVRRALRVLADRGVIEAPSGPGPRSGSLVRHDLVPRDLITIEREIGWEEISEVLIARRLFEPQVAQVAGFVAAAPDLEALERIIELERTAEDVHRLRELDASFHLAMARATHNSTIVAMIHTLLQRVRPAPRPDLTPEQAAAMLVEHERTYEAIASRDPEAISAAMETHLRFHERVWEQISGRRLRQVLPD
jgi:GntR family transcriptional regulator, transcriptional repressor for pyruvate dehydrogenase complex